MACALLWLVWHSFSGTKFKVRKACINLMCALIALLSFASLQGLSVVWSARLGDSTDMTAIASEIASEVRADAGSIALRTSAWWVAHANSMTRPVSRSGADGRTMDIDIPVPASMGLFGAALLELGIMRRRRTAA